MHQLKANTQFDGYKLCVIKKYTENSYKQSFKYGVINQAIKEHSEKKKRK